MPAASRNSRDQRPLQNPFVTGCDCQRQVAVLNFAPSMFGYAQHCPKMNA
jgi:hypothetical protein